MGLKDRLEQTKKRTTGKSPKDEKESDLLSGKPVAPAKTDLDTTRSPGRRANDSALIPPLFDDLAKNSSSNIVPASPPPKPSPVIPEESGEKFGKAKLPSPGRQGKERVSRTRLQGERLVLRFVEHRDQEHLLRWMSKNPVVNSLGIPLPTNAEDFPKWIDEAIFAARQDSLFFYIIEQEDNLAIGYCAIFRMDQSARRGEYALLLGDQDYLGNGYGQECTALMLRLAFEQLNLNRLETFILSEDERSLNSLQQNRFKKEGELYEYIFLDGRYQNVLLLSLLKNEYFENVEL